MANYKKWAELKTLTPEQTQRGNFQEIFGTTIPTQ